MSTSFSRDLYMRAWHFAAARHKDQKVPGSELPYISHVGAVAMEVLATIAIDDLAMEPAPADWSMNKRRAYQRQALAILEQLGSASPSLAARLREKIARYEAFITSP